MSTTFTLPEHLFTGEARQTLLDGLQNAMAGACPRQLSERMADDDLRWDQLTDRAIERVLPEIVALLDAAIAAEWEKEPFWVERRRSGGELAPVSG